MKLVNDTVEIQEKKNKRTPLETVVPLTTPYIMYIDPCGACNFKCNFCPCNTVDYMNEERHKMMSWELFLRITEQIKEFPEQVKVIDLYANGEPLLNKNLPRMIRYLKDNNLCREVRVTTNGSLLNADLNQRLIDAGIDLIRISVESLYEEDYRHICGYNINFEKYMENIADLYARSRGKCKISVKILTAAFHDDRDIKRFVEMFEPISDYRLIQKLLRDMWSEFEEVITNDGGSTYVTSENMVQQGWTICAMPLTMMTIHSNGMVGVCPMDWKFGTKYGDVHEQTLREMWNSEQLRQFRLMHLRGERKSIPYCRGCQCVGDDHIDDVAEIIAKRIERTATLG